MNIKKVNQLIIRQISSFFVLLYYRISRNKKGVVDIPRDKPVIVALTSFEPRLSTLHLAIKSIMNQTVKADRIILYLSDSIRKEEIPSKVKELQQYGLEIEMKYNDLLSHKKYYYVMSEFPEAIIITVDDDSMHHKDLIQTLLSTHEQYPYAVCAKRVHRIVLNEDGEVANYDDWKYEDSEITTPSMQLCPTGVSGVLYPPNLLSSQVFDLGLSMELAPRADDLWLKFIEVISNVPVVRAPGNYHLPYVIQSTQKSGLRKTNVGLNQNDICFKKLNEYFKINWSSLFENDEY